MFFQGQPDLMHQLGLFLPDLAENPSSGMNFLAVAPSGWGKTRLMLLCCNFLCPDGDFELSVPHNGKVTIDERYRVHFIDEIHTMTNAEELYSLLDSERFVLFFATNESGNLPEPFIRRCVPLIFAPYTTEDLRIIASSHLVVPEDKRALVTPEFLTSIVNAGYSNPERVVSLAKRLTIYIRRNGFPDNVDRVLEETFGIRNGMDANVQRYLDALTELGGRASLDTLAAYMHTNRNILLYRIEPVLLHLRRIAISQKGRVLL